ncbi:MAG: hypothetical protein RL621_2173 [Bacteroidota bacterium]|jgi:hypothetical protein
MALPTPEGIIELSGFPPCLFGELSLKPLSINVPSIFDIGFKPLLMGMINASLGPIGVILGALPKFPKPKDFLKPLIDLQVNLPSFLAELFNVQLQGFPSIEIPDFGITLGTGPKLDPLQIDALFKFALGIFKIPLDIILGILDSLLSLNLSFDIPGLIEVALEPFKLAFNPEFEKLKFDLPGDFIKCITQVLTSAFGFLSGSDEMSSASTSQIQTQTEQSKEALTIYNSGKSPEALGIITEYQIKPEKFKEYTGTEAFYIIKPNPNPTSAEEKNLFIAELA